MIRKNQSGQAVLIVLLSLSVVLVIVMYILSRSVTDISLSTKNDDSMRAFSAAEAGIERALVIGNSSANLADASFTASVTDFGNGENEVVYPFNLKSGESAVFWLSYGGVDFNGNTARICWGNSGTNPSNSDTPALEISIFYYDGVDYLVSRSVFDSYSGLRSPEPNNFDSAVVSACTIGDTNFAFQADLDLTGLTDIKYITAKVLYNTVSSHKVGLDVNFAGNSTLPSQGSLIESTGTYANANRKISVYQLNPVAPPIFANVIYSGTGIVK